MIFIRKQLERGKTWIRSWRGRIGSTAPPSLPTALERPLTATQHAAFPSSAPQFSAFIQTRLDDVSQFSETAEEQGRLAGAARGVVAQPGESPYELNLNRMGEQQRNAVETRAKHHSQEIEQKKARAQAQLDDGSIAAKIEHMATVNKRNQRQEIHHKKAKLSRKQEKQRQTKERRDNARQRYEMEMQHFPDGIPSVGGFIDNRHVFIATLILLGLIEVFASIQVFRAIGVGDNNAVAILLAFLFSGFQTFTAEEFGKYSRLKHPRKMKLFGITTLVVSVLIGIGRSYLGEGLLIQCFYVSINLVIAASAAFLGWYRARKARFLQAEATFNHWADEAAALDSEITADKQILTEQEAAIDPDSTAWKDQEIRRIQRKITAEIVAYDQAIEQIERLENDAYQQITQAVQQGLHRYRLAFDQMRHKYSTTDNARIDTDHGNRAPRSGAKSLLLIPILACGLFSCEPTYPPLDIELVVDHSMSNVIPSVETLRKQVLELCEEQLEATRWNDITVTLSTIEATSAPGVYVITLPASRPFLEQKDVEQKAAKKRFLEELEIGLTLITQPRKDSITHSNVVRNLYYRLDELRKKTGQKILICYSDLILNDPEGSNFYLYRDNPNYLLEHRDSVITTMTERYPLPDCHGVTLIAVHTPNPEEDLLGEVAKALFAQYWQSLGIEVRFQSAPARWARQTTAPSY